MSTFSGQNRLEFFEKKKEKKSLLKEITLNKPEMGGIQKKKFRPKGHLAETFRNTGLGCGNGCAAHYESADIYLRYALVNASFSKSSY